MWEHRKQIVGRSINNRWQLLWFGVILGKGLSLSYHVLESPGTKFEVKTYIDGCKLEISR